MCRVSCNAVCYDLAGKCFMTRVNYPVTLCSQGIYHYGHGFILHTIFQVNLEEVVLRRHKRSIENVTQLRDLLQELVDTDPEFTEIFRGPAVSE